jgi:hypothetical protein
LGRWTHFLTLPRILLRLKNSSSLVFPFYCGHGLLSLLG